MSVYLRSVIILNIKKFIDRYIRDFKTKRRVRKLRKNRGENVVSTSAHSYIIFRLAAIVLALSLVLGFGIYGWRQAKLKLEEERLLEEQMEAAKKKEESKPEVVEEEEEEEIEPPIIDLSGNSRLLNTELERINEPIPYEHEILYSAGNTESIDEPVFVNLYLLNLATSFEEVVAHSDIRFGEIYEGRFNEDWITWLDTNQSGSNDIYVYNRKTEEKMKIKTCEYLKPQLRLAGDNMVWVEQRDIDEDSLYLYNLVSGEPVIMEIFDNPTYGTCPPAISDDYLVWVVPSEEDEDKSNIKILDLSLAITVRDDGEVPEDEIIEADEGTDPEIIDPKGFAIYPATYGEAVAWLDNIDPSKANLKLTLDRGKTIIDVAYGVARPYGIGDDFIAYMQDDKIMVYFWELDRYAVLNEPETKARLSQGGVYGDTVIWYGADNPNNKKDEVFLSKVARPSEAQLSAGIDN